MKSRLAWPALAVIAAVLVGAETKRANFHVSHQGSDSFSGTLPQANAGGTDGPLATLERALGAVYAIIGQGLTGASECIFPTYDWSNAVVPIASVDATTHMMVLEGKVAVTPGNRYFVGNVLALFDRPGECRIDLDTRKVYCWPRKRPIAEQTMVASRLNSLTTIQGASPENPVRNVILFEGAFDAIYDFNDWCDDRLDSPDFNLFWKPGGVLAARGGPGKSGKGKLAFGSLDQWKALFDGRFDQHSLVAGPLFVDAHKHGFRLRPECDARRFYREDRDARVKMRIEFFFLCAFAAKQSPFPSPAA